MVDVCLGGKQVLPASCTSQPVDVYLHTNKPVREPAAALTGLRMHTGWSGAGRSEALPARIEAAERALDEKQRRQGLKRWNLQQVFKYEWLLGRLIAERRSSALEEAPWVLADTDTLWTCSGAEMRRRFDSFGAELVVGLEKQRRGVHRPLPSREGETDTAVYWQPQRNPSQPNSGLIMGTFRGALMLLNALHELRNEAGRFPCCPLMFSNGSLARHRCAADDQICIYAALRATPSHGARPRSSEFLDYALDANASLFATVSAWQDARMLRYWNDSATGLRRMGYRMRDDARVMAQPCVLHFAGVGKMGLPHVLSEQGMAGPAAWVPWDVRKLQPRGAGQT